MDAEGITRATVHFDLLTLKLVVAVVEEPERHRLDPLIEEVLAHYDGRVIHEARESVETTKALFDGPPFSAGPGTGATVPTLGVMRDGHGVTPAALRGCPRRGEGRRLRDAA
jgi:hypothetical protein